MIVGREKEKEKKKNPLRRRRILQLRGCAYDTGVELYFLGTLIATNTATVNRYRDYECEKLIFDITGDFFRLHIYHPIPTTFVEASYIIVSSSLNPS